jgi:hypothetical protein
MGGDGNDFLLGGDSGVEHFGGPGNDIIIDGAQRTEGAFGGPGDDWIEGCDGHDGGLFGDNGNVFDLTAGLDPIGGDVYDRSTKCIDAEPIGGKMVGALKLIVSITSVSPSHRPRESPAHCLMRPCARPSSGTTRTSWICSVCRTA